ncbi:hypothetical protein [Salinibacillus xinjiangensis]|uniref:Cytochrome c oxidase subunit 4 n=1 Tax=Salinibacillus xinjiangensis TaxID=1229268 RepID=A0A6G1X571_9BACI|nr:hypothetical protein [Salinibacillus xinjiangensis]MRG86055.1 hypothetical protein [Salinibacillus xinjiangensis]
MFGLLNIGSLVLGLLAWILPFMNLFRYEKQKQKRYWVALSVMSLGACALSLCFQIFYINHKVKVEDWSALMDTMGAVAFFSAVLLVITILLNGATLYVYRDRTTK